MGAQIARQVTAFRVFRAEVRMRLQSLQGSFVSIDVLLTWGTSVSRPCRCVTSRARRELRLHLPQAGHACHEHDDRLHARAPADGQPGGLRIHASSVFACLLYVLGRYFLHGHPVPGFPFLASIIALFSGAQLFALGIIGEYLARMHFRACKNLRT